MVKYRRIYKKSKNGSLDLIKIDKYDEKEKKISEVEIDLNVYEYIAFLEWLNVSTNIPKDEIIESEEGSY